MRTTYLVAMAAAVMLTAAVPNAEARQAQGQAQPPTQAKPEAKPETAASPFAGKWNVNVQNPNGAVESTLDLKVDGKKVSGTLQSQMGNATVEGEITDAKLTFWFSMDANGQTLNITFVGTSQKDGSLAGTLSFGQGDFNWTATKAKN
jgi:hypothetical protein